MLDNRLIQLLDHPDAETRKQAIKDIAKTRDPDALSYLAAVFRTDADAEVREMARKAGVYIKKYAPGTSDVDRSTGTVTTYGGDDDDAAYSGSGAYGSATSLYGDDDDVDSAYTAQEDKRKNEDIVENMVRVAEHDAARAQGLMEQAVSAHMDGRLDKAERYLEQALRRNPNIANEVFFRSVASNITGLPADEAVVHLRTYKAKRRGSDSEVTWGDALIDLGIYWLVNVIIFALSFIGFYLLVVDVLDLGVTQPLTAQDLSSMAAMNIPSPEEFVSWIRDAGVPLIMLGAVVAGFFSVISLLIQYFAIHVVSLMLLGGDGTMPLLIRKVTLFLTFVYPIMIALGAFVSFILTLINPDLYTVGALLQFVVSIFVFYWFCRLIGRAYDFGAGRGCVALFLSTILLSVIFFACAFIVPMLIAGSTVSALSVP
jgi:hypothetical protein